VGEDVIEFRQAYQTLYYNFDHGLPAQPPPSTDVSRW
jgi:hypothetical protein